MIREHREKIKLILFFNHEFNLRVLCGLKESLNLGCNYANILILACQLKDNNSNGNKRVQGTNQRFT